MPRLPSVNDWLWILDEVRSNLHIILPSDSIRCSLAISSNSKDPEHLNADKPIPPTNLPSNYIRCSKVQGLGGIRFTANGDLRLGKQSDSVDIHQIISAPRQPSLTIRNFMNLGVTLADIWEICPTLVLKRIPWAKYPTGSDGILFYAYLYGMHPLLMARELLINDEDDCAWPETLARFHGISPPCLVLDFEYDWRSIIGFALTAIKHFVGGTTRIQSKDAIQRGRKRTPVINATYSCNQVRNKLVVSNTTLNTYAKKAGVKTPGRGKRNHRYTHDDVCKILNSMIKFSSDQAMIGRCQQALSDINNQSQIK